MTAPESGGRVSVRLPRPDRLRALLLLLALASPLAMAEGDTDPDGFKEPLKELKFNPGLDQREFERSTFEALEVYDPWESWNRRVYHFNYRVDDWVLLPLVHGYESVTPRFVRTGVANFFSNLGDVSNLLNSLLQFKGKRALQVTGRLLVNTTVGVVGLWDPASRIGLPKQKEDFGQTLGFYGVSDGPYLVLPILGPSNLRDAGGLAVDFTAEGQIDFLNVPDYSEDHPAVYLLRAVNTRYTTDFRYGQLNSPFEYEKIRYVYTRARELMVDE
jgi:phospholipid-binding lipoprotein MlaA